MRLVRIAVVLLAICVVCRGGHSLAAPDTAQAVAADRTSRAAEASPAEGYLKPEQFGARGDGSDDTAAFLAAHAAIQARGYGGLTLQPGKTYGIMGRSTGALFRLSNLTGYGIDAGGGATIKDLKQYRRGETSVAFQFSNCRNIRIGNGLRLVSEAYSASSNETGLSWFKFVSGCKGVNAEADIDGGLHGFHFYRNYGEPPSASTSDIKLVIRARHVYYPELHERSGDRVETTIDAVDCGRAFFIFGGGNHVTARVTARNSFGFLISSDSAGNGAENVAIEYRDRDSDHNKAGNWRCGLQFYNQRPAAFRNIRIRLDLRNPSRSPFHDLFVINKVSDSGGQDTSGRGHTLDGLDIAGSSEQVNGRKHIATYGAFAAPDVVRNVRIHDFRGTGSGSEIQLALGNALADTVVVEKVDVAENAIRVMHSTGRTAFVGYTGRSAGRKRGN